MVLLAVAVVGPPPAKTSANNGSVPHSRPWFPAVVICREARRGSRPCHADGRQTHHKTVAFGPGDVSHIVVISRA